MILSLTICVDGSMDQPCGVPEKYLQKPCRRNAPQNQIQRVGTGVHIKIDSVLEICSCDLGRVGKQICNTNVVLQLTTHIAVSFLTDVFFVDE